MKFNVLLFVFVLILISGCASTYKKFNVSNFPYKDLHLENEKLAYTARQGVMYNTKNYKYARKEQKDGYTLVAFKIVNRSNAPINVSDLAFSCGGTAAITPISFDEYIKNNKQKPGLYWLYAGLVSPNPFTGKKNLHKVIPIGIAPAVINFALAQRANNLMKKNLAEYDLSNKVLQPNDTVYGILPFKNITNCGEIYIVNK